MRPVSSYRGRRRPIFLQHPEHVFALPADNPRGPLYPTTTRHDRSAKQDNDNCAQFAVNDTADKSQLSFAHDRQLSRLDRLAQERNSIVGMMDRSATAIKM